MALAIDLEGKVVVVTGALGGIGSDASELLAQAGATVVGLDLAEADRDNYFPVDITNEAAVTDVFELIADQFSGIDGLVNIAGITGDGWLLKMPLDRFQNVVAVNQIGTFLCMREAGKVMRAQGVERGGRIVNISSIAREGNPGQVAYAGTKGAVASMTATAAEELAQFGILVNAIAPGPVDTAMLGTVPEATRDMMIAMTATKRLAVPRDISNGVLFLLSELSGHITGETITVSGGLHLP